MSDKVDHYLRLQFLLTESCQVLRQFFDKQCRNDTRPGLPYTDLDSYLIFHEPDIRNLVTGKILRQVQYDLLFLTGSPVKLVDLDVTLLSALLINLYTLQPTEELWIKDIRELRNKLSHYGDITAVTDVEFNRFWNILEGATNSLANTINPSYAADVANAITDLKTKVLTPSVQFLLEIIKNLSASNHDVIQGLKGEIDELKRSTAKTESYLEHTVKVTKTKSGAPCKRMKILDSRLEKMKNRFTKTRERNNVHTIDDKVLDTMYKKLTESRLLHITGSTPSIYLEAAVHVINKLDLDETKCVELKDLSEWRHVDADEVELALILNPLGEKSTCHNAVEEFHKCLDKIQGDLDDQTEEERIYVVVVSNQESNIDYTDMLRIDKRDAHVLLVDPIRCESPNDADDQIVITEGRNPFSVEQHADGVKKHLKERTTIYMNQYRTESHSQDYGKAKGILRRHKILRINGPRLSGKTMLAIQMMYDYYEKRCLILREPSDTMHVSLEDVSVVMIDDVGGKYAPDRDQTLKWYRQFDFLYQAVQARKLSVIVITEAASFDACQLPVHDLLSSSYTVTLTQPAIKMEPSTSLQGQSMNLRYGEEGSLWDASFDRRSTLQRYNDIDIEASTFLPDGRLILVFSDNPLYTLELIDRDLSQTLATLKVIKRPSEISAVSNTEVIITQDDQYLQWINVSTNLTPGHTIDLGDGVECYSVDVLNDEIYTFCYERESWYVRVLSRHGDVLKQIDVTNHLSDYSYIKVGRNGDKVFLSSYIANQIVCLSIEGNVLYRFPNDTSTLDDDDFYRPQHMYVDDNDNVLVCCGWSHNIYIINNDGTQHKVLLDIGETRFERSLSYRKSDGLLVIGSYKKLVVYKARW